MAAFSQQDLNNFLAGVRARSAKSFADTKINPIDTSTIGSAAQRLDATGPMGGRPSGLLSDTLDSMRSIGSGTDAPVGVPRSHELDANIFNKMAKLDTLRSESGVKPNHSHGLLGSIFDTLEKPVNAITGGIRGAIDDVSHNFDNNNSVLSNIGHLFQNGSGTHTIEGLKDGITGRGQYAHSDWGDVLRDAGVHNKYLSGGFGFLGDIILDPLNLLGIGEVKNAMKVGKVGLDLLKDAHGLDDTQKAMALGHHLIDQAATLGKAPSTGEIEAARQAAKPHWSAAATDVLGNFKSKELNEARADFRNQLEEAFNRNAEAARQSVKPYLGIKFAGKGLPVVEKPQKMLDFQEATRYKAMRTLAKIPGLRGDTAEIAKKGALNGTIGKSLPKDIKTAIGDNYAVADGAARSVGNNLSHWAASLFTKPSDALNDPALRNLYMHTMHAKGNVWQATADGIAKAYRGITPDADKELLNHLKADPKYLMSQNLHGTLGTHAENGREFSDIAQQHLALIHHQMQQGGMLDATGALTPLGQHFNEHLKDLGLSGFDKAPAIRNPLELAQEMRSLIKPNSKMDSWLDLTGRVQHALHKTMNSRALAHEIGEHVGEKIRYRMANTKQGKKYIAEMPERTKGLVKNEGYTAVNHPALQDDKGNPLYLFHPELAPKIDALMHLMGTPVGRRTPQDEWGQVVRGIDRATNNYKKVLTIYNPGSHARYMIGSVIQAHINGFRDPQNWMHAGKVMLSKDARKTGNFWDTTATPELQKFFDQVPKSGLGKKVKFSKNLGEDIYDEGIHREMSKRGVLHNFTRSDIQPDTMAMHPDVQVGGRVGKIDNALTKFGDFRDNIPRVAFYLDALERAPKALSNSAKHDWAAHETIKAFHNFGDMAPFERNVMSRLVPFYADVRKNTPMVLRNMFNKPGRIAGYPLGLQETEQATGGKDWSSDPSFYDIVPQYLLNRGAVPIHVPGENPNNPTLLDQKNHVSDVLFQLFGNPNVSDALRTQASSLTPWLRVPAELITKRQFYSGNPINNLSDYAERQTPITDTVFKALHNKETSDRAAGHDTGISPVPFLNELAGIGTVEVSPKQQLSSVIQKINEQKKLAQQLRPKTVIP